MSFLYGLNHNNENISNDYSFTAIKFGYSLSHNSNWTTSISSLKDSKLDLII